MERKKIAVLIGSARKESFSRKVARTLMSVAPDSLEMVIVEVDQIPFYNQDLEDAGATPPAWLVLREQVRACDGLLFVTPEYNRGLPAMLKNAVDVGSRPPGKSVWSGKPAAVVSISPGPLGGFGANHSLRQSLVSLNVPCMQQPEAYLGNVAGMFDAGGNMTADSTREFLTKFAASFARWVERQTA
ncbi:NADPH-dependent FMN reductase [Lacisediminimonas sp.]|uniref:NADPH-dependent FMN reductase n=1 Tax=Lacisediminimonas sp. TaxID=3060582 RepID=UPI0027292062|nr:NAD(P)H-dependent oxidoreductase [Lacisediminimonas sp.]MDO8300536.1 NAD(P)H-dependent oxidoreductase [Lacisediminimonas sp.]MDO9216578.1 NAD(P)H-dependent oxidoreductase [Lacisediminimonas sp.]